MLKGTPYLLEGAPADAVLRELSVLAEQVRGLRRSGHLDERTLEQLRREWRIEQVYETTGIEGNTLDINETRMVLERGLTITGKPMRDTEDALNMQHALDYLETLARENSALRSRDLREIQSLVVGDDPAAGRYRSGDVTISQSDHTPPGPESVPNLVDEVLEWLATKPDCPPPLSAAVVHAWLAHVHPFSDGNGRTARAIMNLILVRHGYPIVLIRRKDRERYYDSLAASDQGDIAPLVDLIVHRSQDSLRQIVRARAEATGITEAVRKAQERVRTQYETWHQAMLLLLRSLDEAAERALDESDGNVRIRLRQYDQVTTDDYAALLKRDKSGNGWLAVVRGQGWTKASELLLWNGYRSPDMARLSGKGDNGASIFVSEPDPMRTHGPFKVLSKQHPFDVREIAFDGGSYLTLLQDNDRLAVERMRANELAGHLVGQFIEHFLS